MGEDDIVIVKSDDIQNVEEKEEEPLICNISIFLQTASYLLDVHALKFAEMSLAHELTKSGNEGACPSYQVAEARLHMHRKQYDKAEKCLRKAISKDIQDACAWSLMGHTYYLKGYQSGARDAYQRTLGLMTPPAHRHLVYTRLADIYIENGQVPSLYKQYLSHGITDSQKHKKFLSPQKYLAFLSITVCTKMHWKCQDVHYETTT